MNNYNNDLNNIYTKIQTYFICLLPISLIFSIFIADLIIVTLFFSFLIICIKNKNYSYFNNIYFKYFFVYWIYITLLSFFSENFLESFKSSFTYIRFIIFPIIVFYCIQYDKKFLKYFFYSIGITFVLLICDSLYEFYFGKNIFGYGNLEKGRLVSFFKDEYVLGSYISKLFFLIASLWFFLFDSKSIKQNLFFGVFYLFSFLVVFLSGDRMPFLLFSFGTIIFLILSKYKISFKILFVTISIFFITLTLLLNQNLYDRLIKKTLFEFGLEKGLVEGSRLYKIEIENGKEITFLTQHYNYFITSYKIFKENPIFGKGNKGFKNNCQKYKIDCCSCASHPHNIYMQLLSENGIIGFLFFFSIFLWISYIFFIQFLKKLQKDNSNIISNSKLCVLICIYLNLWPIAQTGNLFNNWLSIIYFLPIGFLLNELNFKENKIIK
jgi:O-antigen ligase